MSKRKISLLEKILENIRYFFSKSFKALKINIFNKNTQKLLDKTTSGFLALNWKNHLKNFTFIYNWTNKLF